MIPLQDQDYLRRLFSESLKGPVKIEHYTQRPLAIIVPGREECRFCNEARQTLQEISSLSPRLSLRVHDVGDEPDVVARNAIEHVPATVLRGQVNRPLRFYGFFSGTLFPAMIETITRISGTGTDLSSRTKRRLQRIRDEIQIQLFVSPSCPYSPGMMDLVYRCALEAHRIKASVIETAEYPRLIDAYQLRAVPFTRIGERLSFAGAVDEDGLIDQIMRVVERRTLSLGEGFLTSGSRPTTPLAPPTETRPTQSGLFIPGH